MNPNAVNTDPFWMPFTANRDFKQQPRIITSADGHHYTAGDLEAAKAFWQAALGIKVSEENDRWVLFEPQLGSAGLSLQKVSARKSSKSSAHPDLVLDDYESGVERLLALGAAKVQEEIRPDKRWWIMRDPDGNEFCAISG